MLTKAHRVAAGDARGFGLGPSPRIEYSLESTMPLVISDEVLRAADMSAPEAQVEIACRFFDAGKLSFGHAAAAAGLDEKEFSRELIQRHIPRYRYTKEDLEQDRLSLDKFFGE
jgi:predicted HTH domain antitoxin